MGSVGAWTANVLADVCVVGAGPAGLTVTRELAARGVAVCLLEALVLRWFNLELPAS